MSGCGVGLRGVGAGCHRGGMLRFARRQSLSSAAGARGEPLSSVHYVFVHVHLLFHRENLRKRTKGSTNRSVDEAGGRCVCVCVRKGEEKNRDFFFFFFLQHLCDKCSSPGTKRIRLDVHFLNADRLSALLSLSPACMQ